MMKKLVMAILAIAATAQAQKQQNYLNEVKAGAQIEVRTTIPFAEGEYNRFYIMKASGWRAFFPQNLHAIPNDHDSYCRIDRNEEPGKLSIEPGTYIVTGTSDQRDSSTGAFNGTVLNLKSATGNFYFSIECVADAVYKELPVPQVESQESDAFTDLQVDGRRLYRSEFDKIFGQDLLLLD